MYYSSSSQSHTEYTSEISLSSIAGMVLHSNNSKQDFCCSWSILHQNQKTRQQCDNITQTIRNRRNHFLIHIQLLHYGLHSISTCFVWVRVRNFMGLLCFASLSSLFKHWDSQPSTNRLALYTRRVPLILEALFSSSMRRAQDRKWANASPKQPFHSFQSPCLFRLWE